MPPTSSPARRTIEIDEEIHDLLQRTASARGTDINGALHYLLDVTRPVSAPADDE